MFPTQTILEFSEYKDNTDCSLAVTEGSWRLVSRCRGAERLWGQWGRCSGLHVLPQGQTGGQTLNCTCHTPQPCSSSHLHDFKSTSSSGQNEHQFQQATPGEGFVTISFTVLSGQPCDQRPPEAIPEGGNGTGTENLSSHLHVPIPTTRLSHLG